MKVTLLLTHPDVLEAFADFAKIYGQHEAAERARHEAAWKDRLEVKEAEAAFDKIIPASTGPAPVAEQTIPASTGPNIARIEAEAKRTRAPRAKKEPAVEPDNNGVPASEIERVVREMNEADPVFTDEDVKQALARYVDAFGMAQAQENVEKLIGAARVSLLAPENYAAVIANIEKALLDAEVAN